MRFHQNLRKLFHGKKILLPMRILTFFFFKYPRFWKLKLEYFPLKKVFHKRAKIVCFSFLKLIMTEVWKDLRIIFWRPIPPILQLEVGFFSDTKFFSHIFQNLANLFTLNFIFVNLKKNQRNFFESSGAHYQPLRGFVCIGFVGGCQGRGVVGRCTRLRHRTCKTSRSSRKA